MISREEADQLRGELSALLGEDPRNTRRLLERLDRVAQERGIGAHAALLLILTHLAFSDRDARRHWTRIVEHQSELSRALGRSVGLRVAVLDHFHGVNRELLEPTLIDLELLDGADHDAARDPTTGLGRERALRSALQQELRRARRYDHSAALVLFDLDDFAGVNVRFGRLVADRFLREVALVLSNHIRDIDFAARPGEDEFAVLLPETTGNGALVVAERFRGELERVFAERQSGDQAARITVSAGCASYPDDATSPEELLERAARALYLAKACGKNTVQVYRPERRNFVRFELEPGRYEIELRGRAAPLAGRPRNLSRNGVLFLSPDPLEIGEAIEIRLAAPAPNGGAPRALRGTVVRLEELPEPLAVPGAAVPDRYEVGVAFDAAWGDGVSELVDFLDRARRGAGAE